MPRAFDLGVAFKLNPKDEIGGCLGRRLVLTSETLKFRFLFIEENVVLRLAGTPPTRYFF